MSILSDTYAAYLLALAETPAKHAIVAHVDAYIMAANAQKARIRELEAALLKYGHHIPECDYLQGHLPCTCGFEALRSGLNREGEHE